MHNGVTQRWQFSSTRLSSTQLKCTEQCFRGALNFPDRALKTCMLLRFRSTTLSEDHINWSNCFSQFLDSGSHLTCKRICTFRVVPQSRSLHTPLDLFVEQLSSSAESLMKQAHTFGHDFFVFSNHFRAKRLIMVVLQGLLTPRPTLAPVDENAVNLLHPLLHSTLQGTYVLLWSSASLHHGL